MKLKLIFVPLATIALVMTLLVNAALAVGPADPPYCAPVLPHAR